MEVKFSSAELRPLIREIVAEIFQQQQADDAKLVGDRLYYREVEAAALLGLPSHRLRDCRRRGEIVGTQVGRGIGYTRDELLDFLRRQRLEQN